jgi:hypothetical protein
VGACGVEISEIQESKFIPPPGRGLDYNGNMNTAEADASFATVILTELFPVHLLRLRRLFDLTYWLKVQFWNGARCAERGRISVI